MVDRAEIIAFLECQLKKLQNRNLIFFKLWIGLIDVDVIKQLIKDSTSGKDAYVKLGKVLSDADS